MFHFISRAKDLYVVYTYPCTYTHDFSSELKRSISLVLVDRVVVFFSKLSLDKSFLLKRLKIKRQLKKNNNSHILEIKKKETHKRSNGLALVGSLT